MGVYSKRIRYFSKSVKFLYLFPLFVARLLKRGLKLKAYFIAKCSIGFAKFHALSLIDNPYETMTSILLFESAIKNLLPTVDICKRVVSGSTVFVPCPLKPNKNIKLALTWLISTIEVSAKVKYSFSLALGNAIFDAFMFTGLGMATRSLHYQLVRKNRFFLQKSKVKILIV